MILTILASIVRLPKIYILGSCEMGLSIISAGLIALKPLLRDIKFLGFSSTSHTSGNYASNNRPARDGGAYNLSSIETEFTSDIAGRYKASDGGITKTVDFVVADVSDGESQKHIL